MTQTPAQLKAPDVESSGDRPIEITPEMVEVAELALLRFSRERSILEEDAILLIQRLLYLFSSGSEQGHGNQ